MYRVNLLPEQYQNNARNQVIKNRLIYSCFILLISLFLLYRLFVTFGNQRYDEYASLSNENLELIQIIQQLKDKQSAGVDADEIDTIIGKISESSKDISQLLVKICDSSPDDIAISKFSMTNQDQGLVCIINATATSYKSVSEWIVSLSEIDVLGEITSSYINSDEASETGRVLFELRIPIL